MKNNSIFEGQFEGKVAIVSGAGQGIGKQIVSDLFDGGAKIIAVDIKDEQLNNLKKDINASDDRLITFNVDVSKSNDIKNMIKAGVNHFGKIDLLVNNAAIASHVSIEDTSDEIIDKVFSINLSGTLYCVREVLPYMKKNNYGKIVNFSSITGKRGDNSTSPCYGASKGGVIALTKSLARQLGPFHINVNAVAPHAIMTPVMDYWDEKKIQKMTELIPIRRLGSAKDVSSIVLFLLSDASSFITGETINVNGGYYMD